MSFFTFFLVDQITNSKCYNEPLEVMTWNYINEHYTFTMTTMEPIPGDAINQDDARIGDLKSQSFPFSPVQSGARLALST